jgi:SAM-dependent methyltransferase
VRISVGTGGRLGSRPVGYLDWHEQPGYYRDITRHFRRAAKVLDIGCGSGWLAEHFEHYTGVDSMPEAAIAAAAKGRNVLQADVDQPLPFDDASFDGVILKDVLEHVRDPVAVVREARRVVRPDGRIFASSPDAQRWVWDDYTHRRPFTRKSFRLLFADNGFEVEQVGYESVLPGTGIVSGYTRRKRRPAVFRALAWLPVVRRNVWLLARRPND